MIVHIFNISYISSLVKHFRKIPLHFYKKYAIIIAINGIQAFSFCSRRQHYMEKCIKIPFVSYT